VAAVAGGDRSRAARPTTPERPRLVVLRALGLGDLLTAVPALRGLRRAFPEHWIQLAAPAALGPLAALTGTVDETVDVRALEPLPDRLHGADLAVNLHGSGPQSHATLRAARPRRTIGYAAGPWDRGPRWRADEHEVVRWCRLLNAHGIAADPRELALPRPDAGTPADARGATVIHPGAAAEARRWPVERFAVVARALVADGARVLVTGSTAERDRVAALVAAGGLPADAALAGRTDLPSLAALIADADVLIAGDTGVAHLATAMGTPSVVLLGPTPPARWGPPARGPGGARHVALWAGSTGDPHADAPDPGLLRISPEGVLEARVRVLDRGR
jgi:ADP-heptose:LPS heptosyltransferase